MNEKIRNLWQQATPIDENRIVDGWYKPYIALQFAGEPTRHTFTEQELEKFAELIIRKCAKVADLADENKCEWIGGNILTHFGVKSE